MTKLPNVEPHSSLEAFSSDVFVVRGSVVMMPLVRITRNMVVVRAGDDLTLINSVRLDSAGLQALEELGNVKNVVKIGMHGMDDAFYVQRYGAGLWALPGVEHSNEGKTTDELSDDHVPFDGCRLFRFEHTVRPEAALLRESEELLITCDSVQNWASTEGCSAVGSAVTKMMGFMKPAQIGPPWRKKMTPKGGSLKPDFERLAALPFRHLIGGHGDPLRETAKERLEDTINRIYG